MRGSHARKQPKEPKEVKDVEPPLKMGEVEPSKFAYVGDNPAETVLDALQRILPECPDCGIKKMYICIEKCCSRLVPLCVTCDRRLHLGHRMNEIVNLFISPSIMQNLAPQQLQQVDSIISFIKSEIGTIEAVAAEQNKLLECYRQCLAQYESFRGSIFDNFTPLQEVMLEALDEQINNEIRLKFTQALSKVDLYRHKIEDVSKPVIKSLVEILGERKFEVKKADDTNAKRHLFQKNYITETLTGFLEKKFIYLEHFMLENHVGSFIKDEKDTKKMIEVVATKPFSHRCRVVMADKIHKCKADRLVVLATPEVKEVVIRSNVKELFTNATFKQLPKKLQSYSRPVLVRPNSANVPEFQTPLPQNLIKLRIDSKNFVQNKPQPIFTLPQLPKLRHLVLFCSDSGNRTLKQILIECLKKNIDMVCFIKKQAYGMYKGDKLNKHNEFLQPEKYWTHVFPKLRDHHLWRKRKTLQLMAANRQKFIRHSAWTRRIVEYAEAAEEYNRYVQ